MISVSLEHRARARPRRRHRHQRQARHCRSPSVTVKVAARELPSGLFIYLPTVGRAPKLLSTYCSTLPIAPCAVCCWALRIGDGAAAWIGDGGDAGVAASAGAHAASSKAMPKYVRVMQAPRPYRAASLAKRSLLNQSRLSEKAHAGRALVPIPKEARTRERHQHLPWGIV